MIDDRLGYLVNRAARLMAHELADQLRPSGVGVDHGQSCPSSGLGDGTTEAELVRVVAIEPPTLVRTIDRMVRDGLVARSPDPNDRRTTRIHNTDRGRALRDLLPEAVAVNE